MQGKKKKRLVTSSSNPLQEKQDRSIKEDVASGILGSVTKLWKSGELQDFTVEVDNVQFGCHRFILAACSDFFSGLFRSGMQEMEHKKVILKEISSENFELIMESMYTGHDVLANDNLIDIWKAADQLQIQYLMSGCENFVLNTLSMENYAEYFYCAYALSSSVVLERLWPFVLKNCNSFFQTNYFLELPMDVVLRLIKSQDLETKSEDDVIDAILKWVEFQDNRDQILDVYEDDETHSCNRDNNVENGVSCKDIPCRKKGKCSKAISAASGRFDKNIKIDISDKENIQSNDANANNIAILLFHSRIGLASQKCLKMLVRHPLVRGNEGAREIANDALQYQLQKVKPNGHWPSRAVHRNSSRLLHCIVTVMSVENLSGIMAYSIALDKWCKIKDFENCKTVQLAIVNNKAYVLYSYRNPKDAQDPRSYSTVYFSQATTGRVTDAATALPLISDNFCVAVVDSCVYIFSAQEQKVWTLDVNSREISEKSSLPGLENIAYLMAYGRCILVFYTSKDKGVDDTVAQCYDTLHNTWTEINHLEGKADGMTSFEDDHFTYLLQSNGSLWKVVKPQSNIIDFQLVARLWSCGVSLHGAVTYLDDLHIGIESNMDLIDDQQLVRSLPGAFKEITYHMLPSEKKSVFTPILLNKRDFLKNQSPKCSYPVTDSIRIM